MPTNYRVLGQVNAGTAETAVYTVPAATQVVVSSLVLCNTTAAAITVSVRVRPDGAAVAAQHNVVAGMSLAANETVVLTPGITMDGGDVVSALASAAGVAVQLYGAELT